MNSTLSEKEFELVHNSALMKGMSEASLSRLLAVCEYDIATYIKGDIVYSGEMFRRGIGIILGGKLLVTKENADGKRMIMSTLSKGEMFGAASMFNNEMKFATDIKAAADSKIIFLPEKVILRLVEREPTVSENYIRYLSERILYLNKKLYFLTAGTAEQRVSSFLMNNLSEVDETQLNMSMTQIAASLNISRASFYRALEAIIDSGAVIKNGKRMRIANVQKLCDFIV